ncbi:MAG: BspA family leucine-rich repeat surface protein [Gammaproteobacteria bacterium]|nr:BspA family leucine-rich repeat surface protein [Gammaproteobacteria bacterium]
MIANDIAPFFRTDYIEDTSSGTNYNFGQVYVGNLTDMSNLFYDRNGSTVSTFNDNISVWDVSNVTKMNYMFGEAAAFNQDLTGWNVC